MSDPANDSPRAPGVADAARNARNGLMLFFPYLLFYAGFIVLNTFAPGLMGRPAAMGLNLAVLYGFALILGAFALAIVYLWLCRSCEPREAGR